MKFPLRSVAAAAAVALLAACAAVQVSYNNAESLVRYTVWRYVDLDPRQSEALQQRLARFHEWHRENELPEYVAFLEAARGRFVRGLSVSDATWAFDALRSRYRFVAARAATEAAPLLVTLSPEQIESIERKFARDDAKYEDEWLGGSAERRERRAAKRLIDRFEQWTGNLNSEQQDRIRQFVKAHPRDAQLRLDQRRRWQRDAVDLVRRYRRPEELAPRLARLFGDPDAGRPPEYLSEARRWQADLAELVVSVSRPLTPQQRARVLRRIDRYAGDFRSLQQNARVAGASRS